MKFFFKISGRILRRKHKRHKIDLFVSRAAPRSPKGDTSEVNPNRVLRRGRKRMRSFQRNAPRNKIRLFTEGGSAAFPSNDNANRFREAPSHLPVHEKSVAISSKFSSNFAGRPVNHAYFKIIVPSLLGLDPVVDRKCTTSAARPHDRLLKAMSELEAYKLQRKTNSQSVV